MTKEEIMKLSAQAEDAGVTFAIMSLLTFMKENDKLELHALDISKVGLKCIDEIAIKYGIPAKNTGAIREAHDSLEK